MAYSSEEKLPRSSNSITRVTLKKVHNLKFSFSKGLTLTVFNYPGPSHSVLVPKCKPASKFSIWGSCEKSRESSMRKETRVPRVLSRLATLVIDGELSCRLAKYFTNFLQKISDSHIRIKTGINEPLVCITRNVTTTATTVLASHADVLRGSFTRS